ncbi:formate/nitrite transporter family protein [Pelagibius litoralis]|uniref:Formate/nitrite transporter family protein n=1 Tax=Pelagibius litoralis TaxID=374515 RepID=A0A967K852_9PROT|nr:formate/nitrite transporter family protein [Pelagibius litoralis]NIA70243.1 formate/nitrite transporter family protein [Pelagibius litoralis]
MPSDLPDPTGIDAYKPSEIARRIERAGVGKTRLSVAQLLTLSILAGVFIGIGGAFYTLVMTGVDVGYGPARVLGGVAFSLGLILVVVGGAELFTGDVLMVMAWVDRRITLAAMLRAWGVIYLGNFVGAVALALLMSASGSLSGPSGMLAAEIAMAKTGLPLDEAFFRGVLCNALVCLAVWLTFAARSVAGKVLAILWPITAFVALGFEHSVANMYLIPAGMLAGADAALAGFWLNLSAVTLGNIVGGAGGVALTYWLAYRRKG